MIRNSTDECRFRSTSPKRSRSRRSTAFFSLRELDDESEYNNFNSYFILSIFLGFTVPLVLKYFGVLIGDEAVEYYAEVHQSKWNSVIHTLFMPFTYLGFNISVPALFGQNFGGAWTLQKCFYTAYMTHYILLNPLVGLVTAIIYYYIIHLGRWMYEILHFSDMSMFNRFVIGLVISTVSLLIQEFVGHYWGGDDPSRAEGVFNAILYAKYYSVSHLIA